MNRSQELLLSEIKRFQRLYPADEVPERIVEYVSMEYVPRLDSDNAGLHKVHPDVVINLLAKHYEITLEEILDGGRYSWPIKFKKILCYLLLLKTNLNQSQVARLMHYRDHTSVLHHRNSAIDLMQTDPVFRQEVEMLNEKL